MGELLRTSRIAHALALTVVAVGPFLVAGAVARHAFRRGVVGVLVGLAAIGGALAIALHRNEIVPSGASPGWRTPQGRAFKAGFISRCQGRGVDCTCLFERMTHDERDDPRALASGLAGTAMWARETGDLPSGVADAVRACRA